MTNRDWLLLGFLALIFGSAFYFIEVALVDIGVLGVVWARVTLGGLMLTAWAYARGQRLPTSLSLWGLLVLMGFFNNALPFTLITWAQTELTGGLTSLFMSTAPLSSIVLAHFFIEGDKITPQKLIGIALGITGVIVLIGPRALMSLDITNLAQLAAISGAFSYAIAGLIGRRLHHLSNVVASACMLLAASAVLLPFVLVLENPLTEHWTWTATGAIVGMAFFSTALAYIVYFQLLRTVGPSNMLLVTLLAPISAISLGALFLGEQVTIQMLFGAVIIACGLMVIDGRVWRKVRGLPRPVA